MLPLQLIIVSLLLAGSSSFVLKTNSALRPNVVSDVKRFSNETVSRLIGGEETTIDKYPYSVSLQYNSTFFGFDVVHFCAGNIISENWIITGAQCALLVDMENLIVRAGSSYYYENGTTYAVENITIHPDYDEIDLNYDIGLIKIQGSFQFSDVIQPIKLPTNDLLIENGTWLEIASWGAIELFADVSPVIHHISVPTITMEECSSIYPTLMETQVNVFCAHLLNVGPCVGDTGAGAVNNGVLLGTVAWSYGCGVNIFPTVYSSIPNSMAWITEVTGVRYPYTLLPHRRAREQRRQTLFALPSGLEAMADSYETLSNPLYPKLDTTERDSESVRVEYNGLAASKILIVFNPT